jgi:hypothetical protein
VRQILKTLNERFIEITDGDNSRLEDILKNPDLGIDKYQLIEEFNEIAGSRVRNFYMEYSFGPKDSVDVYTITILGVTQQEYEAIVAYFVHDNLNF